MVKIEEETTSSNGTNDIEKTQERVYECIICKNTSPKKEAVCSRCGGVGTMITKIVDKQTPLSERPVHAAPVAVADKSPVFCKKSGTKLIDDSAFCNKCGTPISTPDAQEQKEKTNTFVRPPVDTETPKNKSVSASGVQQLVEESKPKPVFEIDLLDKNLHPKIRRASIFAEDAEWEKAEASLEAVLDEDPTNAYAYIGKLLVDFKVSKTSDLVDFVDVLPENKNYQKAVRFADEKLMRMLMALQKRQI